MTQKRGYSQDALIDIELGGPHFGYQGCRSDASSSASFPDKRISGGVRNGRAYPANWAGALHMPPYSFLFAHTYNPRIAIPPKYVSNNRRYWSLG